jgi:hypothetical protein
MVSGYIAGSLFPVTVTLFPCTVYTAQQTERSGCTEQTGLIETKWNVFLTHCTIILLITRCTITDHANHKGKNATSQHICSKKKKTYIFPVTESKLLASLHWGRRIIYQLAALLGKVRHTNNCKTCRWHSATGGQQSNYHNLNTSRNTQVSLRYVTTQARDDS